MADGFNSMVCTLLSRLLVQVQSYYYINSSTSLRSIKHAKLYYNISSNVQFEK